MGAPFKRTADEAAPLTWRRAPPDPPGSGTPKDIIRGLVLAAGGVTEAQANMLLRVIDRLERIERREGPEAARAAAFRVRSLWLSEVDA